MARQLSPSLPKRHAVNVSGGAGISPNILNLSTTWRGLVGLVPWLLALRGKGSPVPTGQGGGRTPQPVWNQPSISRLPSPKATDHTACAIQAHTFLYFEFYASVVHCDIVGIRIRAILRWLGVTQVL